MGCCYWKQLTKDATADKHTVTAEGEWPVCWGSSTVGDCPTNQEEKRRESAFLKDTFICPLKTGQLYKKYHLQYTYVKHNSHCQGICDSKELHCRLIYNALCKINLLILLCVLFLREGFKHFWTEIKKRLCIVKILNIFSV